MSHKNRVARARGHAASNPQRIHVHFQSGLVMEAGATSIKSPSSTLIEGDGGCGSPLRRPRWSEVPVTQRRLVQWSATPDWHLYKPGDERAHKLQPPHQLHLGEGSSQNILTGSKVLGWLCMCVCVWSVSEKRGLLPPLISLSDAGVISILWRGEMKVRRSRRRAPPSPPTSL